MKINIKKIIFQQIAFNEKKNIYLYIPYKYYYYKSIFLLLE
jgi:hypothetical protein